MLTIRIKQYSFTLSSPFTEGSVLTKAEAQALNALRAENIRNNTSKRVEQELAKLPPGELLSPAQLESLQGVIAQYDRNYKFPLRHVARPRKGELEEMAEDVARERVEQQCRQQGVTLAEPELTARVAEFAALPVVQEEARRRLRERTTVAAASLEELL